MTIELGFDYSVFVQPAITPALAQNLYAAGMRRCCLAIDTADNTFQTAQALTGAGIALDAYRELSGFGQYVTQVQNARDGLSRLSQAGMTCRILWLTAEDTGTGVTHTPDGQRLVGLPHALAAAHLAAIGAPAASPNAFVAAFRAAVDAASGLRVGVYSGAWFWPIYAGNDTSFANLPLWHAGYDGNATLEPVNYGGWTMPFAHQYASPVSVAGSVGLDLDAWGTDDRPAPNPPNPTPPQPDINARMAALERDVATLAATLGRLNDALIKRFEGVRTALDPKVTPS